MGTTGPRVFLINLFDDAPHPPVATGHANLTEAARAVARAPRARLGRYLGSLRVEWHRARMTAAPLDLTVEAAAIAARPDPERDAGWPDDAEEEAVGRHVAGLSIVPH